MAQWVEPRPTNWKVAGLILNQDTCLGHGWGNARGNQSMFLSLPHWFFKNILFYFIRERWREKERERNINVLLLPTWAPVARTPGTYLGWDSNWWPFGLQPTLNPLSYTSQGSQRCLSSSLSPSLSLFLTINKYNI